MVQVQSPAPSSRARPKMGHSRAVDEAFSAWCVSVVLPQFYSPSV